MKKKLEHSIYLSILLLLSVLSHRVWLDPFAILTNGDVWFLYNEAMKFSNWGTWTSFLSLGELNVSYNLFLLTVVWRWVANFGLNYQIANQLVYFFPIVFFSPVIIYSYLYIQTRVGIAAFVGSVFYLFTTIFLILQNGGLLQAVVYGLIPLVFIFFEKYISSKRMMYGIFFVLSLSLLILYENRIAFILLFVLLAYTVAYFIYHYKKKFIMPLLLLILRSLPLVLLLLLINAYMYLPLILSSSIQSSVGQVTSRSLFGAQFYALKNPLTLMHPFWSGKVPTEFIVQGIPVYFWIFPVFAFSALFFAQKNKKIIFFAGISLIAIFLGKSATEPLGDIYTWLYFNFPGFGFFREPSKFWPYIAFTYAVLIAYTVAYTARLLTKRKIVLYLLILPIVAASLYTGKPAFTKDLGPLFRNLSVPQDHIFTKDFIANQQDFFRTYYVPGRYRMGYWSERHPMLGFNEVSDQFMFLNPDILRLLSVKYVLMPADITSDVYRIWGNKSLYKQMIDEQQSLQQIPDKRFGEFTVYENKKGYKPLVYSGKNFVYIRGSESELGKIFSLINSVDPTIFYETSETSTDINALLYKNSQEELLTATCIRCEEKNYLSELVLPYSKILPDSPLYVTVRRKEEKELQSTKGNTPEYLKILFTHSSKRMFEVQRISEKGLSQDVLTSAIGEHKKILTLLDEEIKAIKENTLTNDELLTLHDHMEIQLHYMSLLVTNKDITKKNINLIEENYSMLLSTLQKIDSFLWISDADHDKYVVNVSNADTYDIYVEGNSLDNPTLMINGSDFSLIPSTISGWNWVEGVPLVNGEKKIVLSGEKHNFVNEYSYTKRIARGSGIEKISIPINELDGTKKNYIVSFKYKITDPSKVRFYIERDSDYIQNGFSSQVLDGFLKGDGIWREIRADFNSRIGERKDSLLFEVHKDQNKEIDIELRDIRVIQNMAPLVVLKKQLKNSSLPYAPTIRYQWINSSKYKVDIHNATHPFFLVFTQAYNPGWTAKISSDTHDTKDTIVKVFPDEKVSELKPKNELQVFNFLDLFNKKTDTIPEHFRVNTFANTWYITKTGNYTIDIEFAPQNYFYLSLFISLLAVLGSFIWVFIIVLKRK